MSPSLQLMDRLTGSPSRHAQFLAELLEQLHWQGEEIQLRNALCGAPETMDGTDLLNSLANLGYRWDITRLSSRQRESWPSAGFPLLLRHSKAPRSVSHIDQRSSPPQTP